jgi:PIN domain nuclease of toxin-antitoxin system
MILDTCALLWLAGGDHGRISEKTLNLINKAPGVSIVAITGFEIGIKYRAGKLILPVEPQEWIDSILEFHKIGIISLDLGICTRAAGLPPIHKDPCDRLIISAALMNNLPVVTSDKRFVEYGVNVLS